MSNIELENITGESLDELRERAFRDLYFMAKGVLNYDRLTPEEHRDTCEFLTEEGTNQHGLVGPRWTYKSTVLKAWVIQQICKDPNVRVLYVCKTVGAAVGALNDMRHRIEGKDAPLMPILFPDLVPKDKHKTRWSSLAFEVERDRSWDEATVEAAGLGTNKIHFHYDIIVFDDPLCPDKDELSADSVVMRQDDSDKATGYAKLVPGLLDPEGLNQFALGTTRWAHNDLAAWFQKNWLDMKWRIVPGTNENGEPNYPKILPLSKLAKLRRDLGSFFYMSQFECKPYDPERKPFHKHHLQYYKKRPSRRDCFVTVTVDPAGGKKSRRNDKTSIMAACTHNDTGHIYVLDYEKDWLAESATIKKALDLCERYDPDILAFEAAGYQIILEDNIRKEMRNCSKRWHVTPMTRNVSKVARILQIQPYTENREIFIREGMEDLVYEFDTYGPEGSLSGEDHLLDNLADHIALQVKHKTGPSLVRGASIRKVEDDKLPESMSIVVIVVPTVSKGTNIVVLGYKDKTYFALESEVANYSVSEIEDRVAELVDKWRGRASSLRCAIERKAYKAMFDQTFEDRVGVPVKSFKMHGRELEAAAAVDKGRVVLTEHAADLRDQLTGVQEGKGPEALAEGMRLVRGTERIKVWSP